MGEALLLYSTRENVRIGRRLFAKLSDAQVNEVCAVLTEEKQLGDLPPRCTSAFLDSFHNICVVLRFGEKY
jgi:hypothetical protein